MALTKLENVSPVLYVVKEREDRLDLHAFDATVDDPIDAREVFDLLRCLFYFYYNCLKTWSPHFRVFGQNYSSILI